ncbi:rad17 checkpoint clamp loader component [Rhodnius prolixus]|uniref:rad17 checkpoint clamp loader component n=1 Tax=Rhodnius prolixus TaxID=13249 RepID=UPI003D1894FF
MNWVQPKFTNFIVPPTKKPKTDDRQVKKPKKIDKIVEEIAWLNKWKPSKKVDLVVNKKKIEEVERWLEGTKSKKGGSSYLLLYGPPGCGKLTTLKVLCSEYGISLSEWLPQIQLSSFNPDTISDIPYQSELSVFNDFVTRATRYSNVLNRNSCRIVVVKDIPNQFFKDNSLFHNFLEKFMNVNDVKLVFIVTDFKITRDLFSEDIKCKYNVKTVQFNPVTQRNTLTVLQKISKGKFTEYLDSISLSSAGDLRNAITTLQFLSVKGTLPNKKKQPLPANAKSDSIDLFHGIGRVLYAKREENGKLVHCPIEVAESFISTPELFVNMLHENYLGTFSSIHEIATASNYLTETDLLLKPIENSFSSVAVSVASHALMSYNSKPIKKFQHFNRPTRINDRLAEFKSLSKDSVSLIDIISYGRLVPTFATSHKELFYKVKSFGESSF